MLRTLITTILAVAAAAAPAAAATVTYQGQLADGGLPAAGVYDLRFTLYAAAAGGGALDTFTADNVAVLDGFFSVKLDFSISLDGSALWVEVAVRPGGSSGSFTPLAPRQRVTAAPFALSAPQAETAITANGSVTAIDADTVDGNDGAFFLAWANRTGVPAELADGDDDGLGELACASGEVPFFGDAGWTCSPDRGAGFARTAVVGPVGSAAANGAALLAAVAAIPVPASQADAWQVELEPGRYDLGSTGLELKPWLTLTGAGEKNTVITSSRCVSPGHSGATITGAANATLRDLTAENICPTDTDWGYAIELLGDDVRLERVTARAIGTARINQAVYVQGDRAWLERVSATTGNAVSGNTAISVYGGGVTLLDCTGLTSRGTALVLQGQSWVRRGIFTALASDGIDCGVYIAANADLQDVSAAGPDGAVWVIVDDDVLVTLSRLTAQGEFYTQVNSGSLVVAIEHSRIVAPGVTIHATGGVVGVSASQLWGDPVNGAVVCAGVWDEYWTFYANTCP